MDTAVEEAVGYDLFNVINHCVHDYNSHVFTLQILSVVSQLNLNSLLALNIFFSFL